MKEDRGKYQGYTEARKQANKRYDEEKVDRIALRLPKGKKLLLQLHCSGVNMSVNQFISQAIDEKLERDKKD